METDGKGESEPIDKNDNSAGKANNRRVEFIKI
jgi:outer membrane protein OmpA-like peptidoglycan-associated protein